jgi:hypothetical protein
MVIVFTGGLPDPLFPVPNQLVKSYLIPAAQATKPLALNAPAFQSLERYIQDIEQGEPSAAPLPRIAQEISGQTFRITHASAAGFQAVTLTFTGGDTYRSQLQWPGDQTVVVSGSLKHVFHLNQVEFEGPLGREELLVAVRGHWQADGTFVEEYVEDLKSDIDLITQKYTFAGDKLIIDVSSSMGLFSIQAIGELVK